MRKEKNKKPDDLIRRQAELAVLLGRNQSNVSRMIRSEEWPFSRTGPWKRSDLPEMVKFLADRERGRVPGTGGDPETQALKRARLQEDVRRLRNQANASEVEFARQRGAVVGVDEVKRLWLRVVGVYVNQLQGLAATVAPMCEGKNAAEIHEELEKHVAKVLANVRAGLAELAGGTAGANEAPRENEAQRVGAEEPGFDFGSDGGTRPVEE